MSSTEQEIIDFADFLLLMGFHKGAEQIWRGLSKILPVKSQLGLGATAFRAGNHSKAEEHFQNILQTNPDHYEARLALGYTYLEAGLHTEALDQFDIAALDHPNLMSTLGAQGRAHARLGNFKIAKSFFLKALEVHSENYDLQIDLARCHGVLKEANQLVKAYEAAIICDPKRTEAYLELSHIQILNNDFKAASGLFTIAWRDYHIKDPLLLIRAAQVEEKMGRHDLALYLIQTAAKNVETNDPLFDWRVLWNEIFAGPGATSPSIEN